MINNYGTCRIFLCYRDAGAQTAREFCDALRNIREYEYGRVWYSDYESMGNYVLDIPRLLSKAQFAVLFIHKGFTDGFIRPDGTNNYSDSGSTEECATVREIIEIERQRQQRGLNVLCVNIDGYSLSDEELHILEKVFENEGLLKNDTIQSYRNLQRNYYARRYTNMETFINDRFSKKISKNTVECTVQLLGTPISPDKNFTGRNQELKKIEKELKRSSNKVALVGIGGIGKSELAKKYAKLHENEYSAILWIPFEKSLMDTFINDSYVFIPRMRRSNYPEYSDREYFKEKLLKLRELSYNMRILLIIDNFNVSDDPDLDDLCQGTYSVIFTTKNRGSYPNITYIEISKIKDSEKLIELFKNNYQLGMSKNDDLAVRKLIDLYCGHTLSILLIAGVAHSRRISPSEMYKIMSKHSFEYEKTDKEKKTSDAVFEAIKHVFSMAELSDDEKILLCVLSLVPSCGITVKLLHELCGNEDYEVTDGLIMQNWVIQNSYTDEVFLHPIIAEIALNLAYEHQEDCKHFFESLLNMTEMDVVNDDYKKKQLNLKLINSVDSRIDYRWRIKRKIRYRHAKVLYDNAQYEQGGKIFTELLETETEVALILHCYEKIAQAHILTGEYEAGCEIAERGWEYTKTIPTDKIDALVGRYYVGLLHRLIESYRGIGNYEKSLFYGKQCLENCTDFYNTYRGDSNAWTRYHIGRTLLMKGDYAESETILLCASDFFAKSEDKNGDASCCALLGLICAKQDEKDFNKALSYISKAKKIRLSIDGDSSIDYIELIKLEGDIYREMGNIQKARELYSDALELYKKTNHKTLEKEIDKLIASIDQKS